jgi:hypothetical protein
MSAAATHEADRPYRDALRNRHVAGLLLGDRHASLQECLPVRDHRTRQQFDFPLQARHFSASQARVTASGMLDTTATTAILRLSRFRCPGVGGSDPRKETSARQQPRIGTPDAALTANAGLAADAWAGRGRLTRSYLFKILLVEGGMRPPGTRRAR